MRDVYAEKALSQIPRLLTMLDRNPFSPTYGCFFREYWHEKIIDHPSALYQYSVYCLALVYAHQMPGNIYYRNPNIKKWILATLDYSIGIQHKDGSFDEFYPNERGRAVTALLLYAFSGTLRELKGELTSEESRRYRALCDRCAAFVRDFPRQTFGLLANHFTMIMCALIFHYQEWGDERSLIAYERYRDEFLGLCNDEGWSVEYDGPDMGYLTAVVSFIAKLSKLRPDPKLREIVVKAVGFSALFVYPNGFFGGSMGSRQTQHFYSYGFEYFGRDIPLAQACAERMLKSLKDGKLVPPEIMSGRYTFYRIEEYLLSYLDYSPRSRPLPPLPCEGDDFARYFPAARIFVRKRGDHYILLNLLKSGILKVFEGERLVYNDTGIHLSTTAGDVFSSQWVDEHYRIEAAPDGARFSVSGALARIPMQLFRPLTMAAFKLFVSCFGNSRALADVIKKSIRRVLIVKAGKAGTYTFVRDYEFAGDRIIVRTTLTAPAGSPIKSAGIGGEIHQRYVPQSRYFQAQELAIEMHMLSDSELAALRAGRPVTLVKDIALAGDGSTDLPLATCTNVTGTA